MNSLTPTIEERVALIETLLFGVGPAEDDDECNYPFCDDTNCGCDEDDEDEDTEGDPETAQLASAVSQAIESLTQISQTSSKVEYRIAASEALLRYNQTGRLF